MPTQSDHCYESAFASALWQGTVKSGSELSRLHECRSLAEAKQQGVAAAQQHHGKEMSYNNYLDADAAYSAVCDYAGADSVRAAATCTLAHWYCTRLPNAPL